MSLTLKTKLSNAEAVTTLGALIVLVNYGIPLFAGLDEIFKSTPQILLLPDY